jgi:hypothetical protein
LIQVEILGFVLNVEKSPVSQSASNAYHTLLASHPLGIHHSALTPHLISSLELGVVVHIPRYHQIDPMREVSVVHLLDANNAPSVLFASPVSTSGVVVVLQYHVIRVK